MITTNSILKLKKNINISETPFAPFTSAIPNILNAEFKVTSIHQDYISFINSSLGAGIISFDELDKYFNVFAPNVPNDEFEIDPTPYSAKWTKWTEYTYPDGTSCLYRYKDTAYGSVKLECKFIYINDGNLIGRACCHKDDEFNLEKGLEICKLRAYIKDCNHHIANFENSIKSYAKRIAKYKEWINDNNACVNIWKGTKETYEMVLADVLNSSN